MPSHPSPRFAPAVLAAVLAAACSSSLPSSVSAAPVLSVATGLWPLAQAATAIGGDKAAVVDVVPAGTNPLTWQPDAAAQRILRSSGLVLEIGGGFQAALEAAASGAPRVSQLGPVPGTNNPYVWLDPMTMGPAVTQIADAMAAANPAAAALYHRNEGAFQDQIHSLGIDFSSTLSSCPGTVIVTPDAAFSSMAASYGLQDHVIGPAPSPEKVAAEKADLQARNSVAVLSQTWVDNSGVRQVASAAGLKVHAVDTLAGVPVTGTAVQNTYVTRMEQILGVVSGGLGCNANEQ